MRTGHEWEVVPIWFTPRTLTLLSSGGPQRRCQRLLWRDALEPESQRVRESESQRVKAISLFG